MINHTKDELSSASSHRNDENISRIIFIGLSAIVKTNMASGAPNARNAQPKNSATVIVSLKAFSSLTNSTIARKHQNRNSKHSKTNESPNRFSSESGQDETKPKKNLRNCFYAEIKNLID